MRVLYLNSERVDIQDKPIPITKQINDIAELRNSQSHFTPKVKLPFTARNKKVLKGLGIMGSKSREAYKKIPARYLDNGEDLIPDGYAVVFETRTRNNAKEYRVALFDGNILFFEAIGNKNISELDLSDLNHELTTGNYVDSFGNTWEDGYIYAVSDYGNFNPDEIVINYQLPSFFVAYIWDKIWSESGFEYQGDAFQTDEFRKLVITAKRGYVPGDTQAGHLVADQDDSTSSSVCFLFYTPVPQSSGELRMVEDSYYGVLLTTDVTGQYTYRITIHPNDSSGVTPEGRFYLLKNGSNYAPINHHIGGVHGDEVIEGTTGVLYDSSSYYFAFYPANDNPDNQQISSHMEFGAVAGGAGIYVNVSTFIGEVSQKQFIKDVMQHFGLMMQHTRYSKQYRFKKRTGLIEDTALAQDWTDKFDKEERLSYRLGYAQNNIFAYHYIDEDGIKHADGVLKVDNTSLPVEKVHLRRPYNACEVSDKKLNSKLVTYTPFWKPRRDEAGNITQWDVIKGKNFFAKIETNIEEITYKTEGGSALTYGGGVGDSPIPRLTFIGLGYQHLIERHYTNIKKTLDWNKVMIASFNLRKNDVNDVDFLRLKYAKQIGSFFILNKIIRHKGGSTKCEILLVPPIEQNTSKNERERK